MKSLSVEKLLDLRPGGFADTVATAALLSPILASSPAFSPFVMAASSAIAIGGGVWWSKRYRELQRIKLLDSSISITSDEIPILKEGEDGITLGYCVDNGQPLTIPFERWTRHGFIAGQSGTGKSVFLFDNVMFQQILRGGGVLCIDGKIDSGNLHMIRTMLAYAGRLDDLIVIDTGSPDNSNTYNPVLIGDPDEVASRLVSMIPSSENSPGTDYYRSETTQGLTILISAIQATGMAYNLMDLAICLFNATALEYILEIVPEERAEKQLFALFLHKYRNNQGQINVNALKDTFGGMAGRLLLLGSGNFGKITSSYDPDLSMYDAILENKIVYIALETMGKQETAMQFGKLVIGDLRSALGRLQRLPPEQRPDPPFLVEMDEAGSYMTEALGRTFEQARSARVTMLPAVQTFQNLTVISEQLLEFVIGNAETNVFFKIGSDETATAIAELIGKEMKKSVSISNTASNADDKTPIAQNIPQAQKEMDGFSVSEQLVEDYRVSKEMLKGLDTGEAIVLYQKSKVYHIRVPMLDLSKIKLPEFKPNSFPRASNTKGLGFYRKETQEKLTSGMY